MKIENNTNKYKKYQAQLTKKQQKIAAAHNDASLADYQEMHGLYSRYVC